jgi:hypothetical protein
MDGWPSPLHLPWHPFTRALSNVVKEIAAGCRLTWAATKSPESATARLAGENTITGTAAHGILNDRRHRAKA